MTRTLRATSSLQTTRKNWWKFSFVELSTYTTLANDRPVSLPVECLYVIDRVRVIWIIRVYEEWYIESFSFSFSVSFHQWCFERIQNLWRIMYRYEARALSGYIGDDRLERTNSFDCFFLSLFSLWVTCQRDIFMQMNRKGSMAFRTGKYFLSLWESTLRDIAEGIQPSRMQMHMHRSKIDDKYTDVCII